MTKAMDGITVLTITIAIAMLTASIFMLRAGTHCYGGDHEEEIRLAWRQSAGSHAAHSPAGSGVLAVTAAS